MRSGPLQGGPYPDTDQRRNCCLALIVMAGRSPGHQRLNGGAKVAGHAHSYQDKGPRSSGFYLTVMAGRVPIAIRIRVGRSEGFCLVSSPGVSRPSALQRRCEDRRTSPAMRREQGGPAKSFSGTSAYPDSYGACPGHDDEGSGRPAKSFHALQPYPDSYGDTPGHGDGDGGDGCALALRAPH